MEHEDYVSQGEHITEEELKKFLLMDPIIKELDGKISILSSVKREEDVPQDLIEKHFTSIEFLNIKSISELEVKLKKNKNNILIIIGYYYPGVTRPFNAGLSLFYLYQVLVAQFLYSENAKEYLVKMEFGVCKQDIDELYNFLKKLSESFR